MLIFFICFIYLIVALPRHTRRKEILSLIIAQIFAQQMGNIFTAVPGGFYFFFDDRFYFFGFRSARRLVHLWTVCERVARVDISFSYL